MYSWTFSQVDPADPYNDDNKSVLELCIVSSELFAYVENLVIDKDRKQTPFRPINIQKVTYTDHYTLIYSHGKTILSWQESN